MQVGDIMEIDITSLKYNKESVVKVDEVVSIPKEDLENTDIIELKDVRVKGEIYRYGEEDYELNLVLDGVMVLPCSLTLKPTDYKFNTEISGVYTEMMQEIENFSKKIENSLDIFPIIWENILMEIPIKVTCPEATDLKLSGDGWKLVTEESVGETNSAFDKLKDLL